LREVQVFDYNNVNKALGKFTTQSSDDGGNEASNAVDDNLSNWSHTQRELGKSYFFRVYSAVVWLFKLLGLIAFLVLLTHDVFPCFLRRLVGG
jgi:hypothetical protein